MSGYLDLCQNVGEQNMKKKSLYLRKFCKMAEAWLITENNCLNKTFQRNCPQFHENTAEVFSINFIDFGA